MHMTKTAGMKVISGTGLARKLDLIVKGHPIPEMTETEEGVSMRRTVIETTDIDENKNATFCVAYG